MKKDIIMEFNPKDYNGNTEVVKEFKKHCFGVEPFDVTIERAQCNSDIFNIKGKIILT